MGGTQGWALESEAVSQLPLHQAQAQRSREVPSAGLRFRGRVVEGSCVVRIRKVMPLGRKLGR